MKCGLILNNLINEVMPMALGTQKDIESGKTYKELEDDLTVHEIMNRSVYTIDIDASVVDVAQMMSKYNVGSIIVMQNDNPVGIITERDMVKKILTGDIRPSRITAGEIMSSPLITTKPSTSVIDAAELMVKSNIRRLIVMQENKIGGFITDRDVLTISSGLNTILKNLIEMNQEQYFPVNSEAEATSEQTESSQSVEQGICEYCGTFSENLKLVNGMMLCESCRDEEYYEEK